MTISYINGAIVDILYVDDECVYKVKDKHGSVANVMVDRLYNAGETICGSGKLDNIVIDGLIALVTRINTPDSSEQRNNFTADCIVSTVTKVGETRYIVKLGILTPLDYNTIDITYVVVCSDAAGLVPTLEGLTPGQKVKVQCIPEKNKVKNKKKYEMMARLRDIKLI